MRSLPIPGDSTSLPRDAVTSRMEDAVVSFFISYTVPATSGEVCFKDARQEEILSFYLPGLFICFRGTFVLTLFGGNIQLVKNLFSFTYTRVA